MRTATQATEHSSSCAGTPGSRGATWRCPGGRYRTARRVAPRSALFAFERYRRTSADARTRSGRAPYRIHRAARACRAYRSLREMSNRGTIVKCTCRPPFDRRREPCSPPISSGWSSSTPRSSRTSRSPTCTATSARRPSTGCRRTELHQRVHRIYHRLGDWLADRSDDSIENAREALGRQRFHEQVPLAEIVYAIMLMKQHLRDRIRSVGNVYSAARAPQRDRAEHDGRPLLR